MKWVLADPHFFHKKIVTHFMYRPYASVEDMNDAIINKINAYVKRNHELYLLGDISFEHDMDKNLELLRRINCENIHLVIGNHDYSEMRELPIWKSVSHYLEIKCEKKFFVLSHYPLESWNKSNKGSIMVHGHCHGNSRKRANRFDVGWDVEHRPVSLPELALRWESDREKWIDHHETVVEESRLDKIVRITQFMASLVTLMGLSIIGAVTLIGWIESYMKTYW